MSDSGGIRIFPHHRLLVVDAEDRRSQPRSQLELDSCRLNGSRVINGKESPFTQAEPMLKAEEVEVDAGDGSIIGDPSASAHKSVRVVYRLSFTVAADEAVNKAISVVIVADDVATVIDTQRHAKGSQIGNFYGFKLPRVLLVVLVGERWNDERSDGADGHGDTNAFSEHVRSSWMRQGRECLSAKGEQNAPQSRESVYG